ncbi:MAG: hypothetical protein MI922_30455, partial [Bacteroidales bacterium]|nr:hypothetical protein [Bacteroidales bacterium]
LPADKQTITHFYILPDYYKVRLFRDKKLVRQEHVHIITNGWRKFVAYKDKESYLLVTDNDNDLGKMHVAKAQVEKSGLKLPQNYWIKHRNIQNFKANTNNFTLETSVKNAVIEGGLGCQMISLYVLGEHGRIHIKFSKPGCFSNISLQFGNEIVDGKFANLSAFSTDFSQWRKVKLVSINNDISVYLDSNLIFKTRLNKNCGNIKGLLFDTEGSGAMDYCYLKDENGEAVYKEEF